MKKILILLISVILLLSSCSVIDEGNETTVTTDPPYIPTPEEVWGIEVPETALFELPYPNEEFLAIQNRYTDEQLEEIGNYTDLELLNQMYPFEYIMKTYEDYFYVVYLGMNNTWIRRGWDINGKSLGFTLVKPFPTVTLLDFLTIKAGDTLTELGEMFTSANSNRWVSNPLGSLGDYRISYHSTADGFFVEIYYSLREGGDKTNWDDWLVYDIKVEEL